MSNMGLASDTEEEQAPDDLTARTTWPLASGTKTGMTGTGKRGSVAMSFEHWLAFAAASSIMLAIPGPTILLVVSYALSHGRKPAAAIVAGVALGDLMAMTASMLGLGVLLMTSSELFTLLRWLGGAYLVYLGIKLWRAPLRWAEEKEGDAPARSARNMFAHSFAVTALNPKSIVFFVAFVPQFLDASLPYARQVIVLEATFVTLAILNAAGYALLAAAIRPTLQKPKVQRIANRTGGGLLVSAGVFAAGWRSANA